MTNANDFTKVMQDMMANMLQQANDMQVSIDTMTKMQSITEQMAAYPILDTSGGDFKKKPDDPHALFRMRDEGGSAGPVVGVEICLDHSDHRMRKAVARSPWPQRHDGLDLHLVPSCGMQLHPQSVAAHAGGWAFNCDGQYALGSADQSGSPPGGAPGGSGSASKRSKPL